VSDSDARVNIVLNGSRRAVPADGNLILAAAEWGVEIPHLCFHPGLGAPASCGMCGVEVEVAGVREIVKACQTFPAEGMEVRTDTPPVHAARAAALGFIFSHHGLDCARCEKAGECELQEYAHQYGVIS